jgi:hypothetical protein
MLPRSPPMNLLKSVRPCVARDVVSIRMQRTDLQESARPLPSLSSAQIKRRLSGTAQEEAINIMSRLSATALCFIVFPVWTMRPCSFNATGSAREVVLLEESGFMMRASAPAESVLAGNSTQRVGISVDGTALTYSSCSTRQYRASGQPGRGH